jgi:hypothetical protein
MIFFILIGLEVFIVIFKIQMVCFKNGIGGVPLKTIGKLYSIEKKSVGFVKFIFEAYDGIAVVETIDRHASIIKLHIAPGCEADVDNVLIELKKEILIEPVSADVVSDNKN